MGKQYAEAEPYLDRAIAINPTLPDAPIRKADLLQATNKPNISVQH
jgi:hypothetical protein